MTSRFKQNSGLFVHFAWTKCFNPISFVSPIPSGHGLLIMRSLSAISSESPTPATKWQIFGMAEHCRFSPNTRYFRVQHYAVNRVSNNEADIAIHRDGSGFR